VSDRVAGSSTPLLPVTMQSMGVLMEVVELRDLDEARQYLLHGLLLQRASQPGTVREVLAWGQEIAANGDPLPPLGFVADLGQAVFHPDRSARAGREAGHIPGLPPGLMRLYEDLVLGKFYADWAFERAADALRHYQPGRDRARGLAFVVRQFREQAHLGGVLLAPALFRSLLELNPEEVLQRAWDGATADGLTPLLVRQYEALTVAIRRCPEVLTAQDVFELEKGTALAELGQRVALRQVLDMTERLNKLLPVRKVKPLAGRQEVPTRVLDEDTYPVGGFASISTKGSVESLLHSQLAFMELERPDLFDVKFVRDELYYYSRDENQFLRRRRTFVFALAPELTQARYKDADLPCQRLILVLALVVAAVRRLTDWLGEDALRFEVIFAGGGGRQPLAQERDLLKTILSDHIANGAVELHELADLTAAGPFCTEKARRSLCHCLVVAPTDAAMTAEDTVVTRLVVDRACPALGLRELAPERPEAEEPFEGWGAVLEKLLQLWV
jgi:vWA domain found in the FtsH ternary systems/N-terminal helical region fused to the FtsH ternary system vWA domain